MQPHGNWERILDYKVHTQKQPEVKILFVSTNLSTLKIDPLLLVLTFPEVRIYTTMLLKFKKHVNFDFVRW